MESEILRELMDDNKPTRKQKAKQGILISFRVIVILLTSFLTWFITDWRRQTEKESDQEFRKDSADLIFKQTIINQLSVITALNVNRDEKLEKIEDKLDRLQNTKADREDLRRLETRIDNKLGLFESPFKSFPDTPVNKTAYFIPSRPTY